MGGFMHFDTSNFRRIGSGAHWIVYRSQSETSICIDGEIQTKIVFKKSNQGRGQVDKNILAYTRVKESKLQTLKIYHAITLGTDAFLVAEDLSVSETIFVSPNTARALPTKSSILVDSLLNRIQAIEDDRISESAEQYLMKNKILLIRNFDQFIELIYHDMRNATENGLGLCEDAFFFGINPADGMLQYKIADFDTIITEGIPNTLDICNRNKLTMLNALWEFIDHFVDESIANIYKSEIEDISRSISISYK